MLQLERCVARICADIHSASANYALDKEGVVDIVERVDANAIAFLDASRLESCNKLSDQGEDLPGREAPSGIFAVDIELLEISKILWRVANGCTGLS